MKKTALKAMITRIAKFLKQENHGKSESEDCVTNMLLSSSSSASIHTITNVRRMITHRLRAFNDA